MSKLKMRRYAPTKAILLWVSIGMLVVTGCISGMYSSDISVSGKEGGVTSFSVVENIDENNYPETMPVVVQSKSTNVKDNHVWNHLLWMCTIGIVPGIESETTTYDITVKTPLGEKSGKCSVSAGDWVGWLPLIMPYPAFADERISDYARLPNKKLEDAVQGQLITNLVSQFPSAEYSKFVNKKNDERKNEIAHIAQISKRIVSLIKEHRYDDAEQLHAKEAVTRVGSQKQDVYTWNALKTQIATARVKYEREVELARISNVKKQVERLLEEKNLMRLTRL